MQLVEKRREENYLEFEVRGEGHTLCGILVDELLRDEHVVHASYWMDHPVLSPPLLRVRTQGKTPEDAIIDAVKRIHEQLEDFRRKFADSLREALKTEEYEP